MRGSGGERRAGESVVNETENRWGYKMERFSRGDPDGCL